jgi:hypothetical protein
VRRKSTLNRIIYLHPAEIVIADVLKIAVVELVDEPGIVTNAFHRSQGGQRKRPKTLDTFGVDE